MSTPHNEPPTPEKRWTPKKITKIGCLGLIGLFILLFIIGLIGAAMSGTLGKTPPKESPASTAAASPSPSETTAEPAPSATSSEPTPTPEATAPSPEPTTDKPEPTKEPTEEPAKSEAPKDPFVEISKTVEGAKVHQETSVLFIEMPLQEGFTGPSKSLAQKDTVDLLKAVKESGADYSRVFVQGSAPVQDKYGNQRDAMLLNVGYDKATVERINFDNVVVSDIWDLRDGGAVNPQLQ